MQLTQWVLALSNLVGLPSFFRLWFAGKYGHAGVMMWVMGSSFMMHLTETKHDFKFPIHRLSQFFLNQDRVMSVVVGGYCAYLWYQKPQYNLILPGLLGIACVMIGEIRTRDVVFNQLVYPFLHSIWHFVVYYNLSQLL